MNETTKEEFLTTLLDVRSMAAALLDERLAGRAKDRPETAEELRLVLNELREVEERVMRGDPLPDAKARAGAQRLVSGRVALDWNDSELASRVMDLTALYRAL